MRKAWILMLLTLTLLAACNLPTNQTQPTTDIVATQVAMMLTSQPTPQVIEPTTAPTEAPSATVTQTATNTAEPSPTATVSASDPREFLGEPDFTDTLDSGKSFGLEGQPYDDDYTIIRVENGALVLTSRYATGFHGWRTGGTKLKDAYIEAPMRVADCSGGDTYGLVLRSPDFVKGYWFSLTCGGDWAFGYWNGEEYVNLKDGSNPNGAILTGSNQTNRVGVMASGSDFQLYINGVKIADVQDETFAEAGSFGALISAFSTPNFTLTISEFTYWTLP